MWYLGNGAAGKEVLTPPPSLKPNALGGSSQAGLATLCPPRLPEAARLIYSLCHDYTLLCLLSMLLLTSCLQHHPPPPFPTQSPQQVHTLTFPNAFSLNAPRELLSSSEVPQHLSHASSFNILLMYVFSLELSDIQGPNMGSTPHTPRTPETLSFSPS